MTAGRRRTRVPARRYGRLVVETSREEKLLFPKGKGGFSKGDVLDYYECAWERMRPHLVDRPLVMERFPDGIAREGFFQKQVSDYFPRWLPTVRVDTREGAVQELVVCDTKAALAFLADQACVTPHLWLSRTDRLDIPDQLVFDLDPPARDFAPVRRAASWCKALLDELGLRAVVKTTGSRGVHVIVPLRRMDGFDAVRDFAKGVARVLVRRHPETLTTEQRKARRRGRLYVDVARNAYGQTVVAPYGVRARAGAPIAAPITWAELADRRLDARSFTLANIADRLRARDPWAGWRRGARTLARARGRLARLERGEDS